VPVDFAAIAAGYGCKTYRVTTLEQLKAALEDGLRDANVPPAEIFVDHGFRQHFDVDKRGNGLRSYRHQSAAENHDPQIFQLVARWRRAGLRF
jgi:hypothetical protein